MQNKNKHISMILYLPITMQYFHVNFSMDLSLEANLKLFNDLVKDQIKDNYVLDEAVEVYIKNTSQKCDVLVPLYKLGLYENITLVLL